MERPNLYGKCDKHPDCREFAYRSGSKFCKACWVEFETQSEILLREERHQASITLVQLDQFMRRILHG